MVRYIGDARWIRDFLRAHGYAPTYDEIGDSWGLRKNSVFRRLWVLRRMGLIGFASYKHQTLRAFVPDRNGRRRAYFALKPALTIHQVETTELSFICDG